MMCSAYAERDVSFGRDVRFAHDVSQRDIKGKRRIISSKASDIIFLLKT